MSPKDPKVRSTHWILLVASGGLLAVALFLEFVIADQHAVSIFELHQHTFVPVAVHLFAIASMMLSLLPVMRVSWLALKRSRLSWQLAAASAAFAAVLLGYTMPAALSAFTVSLGALIWRHLSVSRAGDSDRSRSEAE